MFREVGRHPVTLCCPGRNKKGLHECKPLMCLVANQGLEPRTCGL